MVIDSFICFSGLEYIESRRSSPPPVSSGSPRAIFDLFSLVASHPPLSFKLNPLLFVYDAGPARLVTYDRREPRHRIHFLIWRPRQSCKLGVDWICDETKIRLDYHLEPN